MTEIAGAASVPEMLSPGPHGEMQAAEARHECANCGTHLQGPFCHACGQKGHLHNKLRHLVLELVEGVAHLDGRFWRTLPLLAFRPGRLSRAWIEGKRARYVAPLHVFLFSIFLLFVIPSFTGRHLITLPTVEDLGGEGRREIQVQVGTDRATIPMRADETAAAAKTQQHDEAAQSAAHRLGHRLRKVIENNEYYGFKIETLAYKLSFVIVPISMAILWLLMLFKRGYTLYDHGVVSLYGVGFFVLMIAIATAFPGAIGQALISVALLYAPVHAVLHLHGAYRTSWTGEILRGFLLGIFSALGFSFFLLGVFALGVFA